MRNGKRNAEAVVKIRCTAGHVVACTPAGVRVTQAQGLVVGHEVWCERCGAFDSQIAEPQRIAMLLELGVEIAPYPCDVVMPVVGDDRRIVSAKYLLEDEVVARLSGEAPEQDVLEHPSA